MRTSDMYKSGLVSERDQLAAQEGYNQAVSAFEKAKQGAQPERR